MILVTGGTGLTGSHILLNLTLTGSKLRALIREGSSTKWVKRVFQWYRPEDHDELFSRIEWYEGDMTDIYSLRDAMAGVKNVYHCAAVVSYHPADKPLMMKINVEGTANIVNVALQEGVKKFCHCSSISSLGIAGRGEVVDESCFWKTSPRNSNYAISKFNSEREVWRGSEEGLDVVVVNPSIIIGPGDPSRSSGQIFKSLLGGLRFYSNGITGYVDVRDVADIMINLMNSNIKNQRFILNSENISYKELFNKIAKCYGIKPPKYEAGKFLSAIAWRLERARSAVTGSKPLITKETAISANKQTFYSNKKILDVLEHNFTSIDDAVDNACRFLKKVE